MADVYQIVTNKIIEQLNDGVIPWKKPWHGVIGGAYNRISQRPYSFLNQMLLKHEGEYASYKQWLTLGGQVRKGEKSEIIVFYSFTERERKNKQGELVKEKIPFLKYYSVFHISQVDGVEPLEKPMIKHDFISEAEEVRNNYCKRENLKVIETKTNRAFYSPAMDYVQVPVLNQYDNAENFYGTLFHELIHSTGHKNRLDRFGNNPLDAMFGSESYSKEELVAEIGSSFILNLVGIETDETFQNSVSYIKGWLQALKNDKKLIVSASSRAEKAAKYIFGEEVMA